MKIPPFLKEGDTVAIVCTARKISKEELNPAITLLQNWGLQVKLGKTIGQEDHQFGGTDAQRAKDFQTILDDDEVKAIWCARGGYGTVRMIDEVNFSNFKKTPKWIIGYSDPTVLHCHIHNLGVASIHGQMCLEVDKKSEASRLSLKAIFFGSPQTIAFTNTHKDNKLGVANGELIGGNLSVIYSLLGSPNTIETKGKILFLEDLDEYLYHIDRMMQNLKRNGMLKNLAGLVIGGLTDMRDNTIPFGKTATQIVADTVKEYDYPICFNAPSGHSQDNEAMIFGANYSLVVAEEKVTITPNDK
jgi:muramoyltetrapeptide carboxypeptidase